MQSKSKPKVVNEKKSPAELGFTEIHFPRGTTWFWQLVQRDPREWFIQAFESTLLPPCRILPKSSPSPYVSFDIHKITSYKESHHVPPEQFVFIARHSTECINKSIKEFSGTPYCTLLFSQVLQGNWYLAKTLLLVDTFVVERIHFLNLALLLIP